IKPSRTLSVVFAFLLCSTTSAAQQNPRQIASSFPPPRTQMAQLDRFDSNTGKPIERTPAVLTGHFLSPKSEDMVLAYTNTADDPQTRSLFVAVLHKVDGGDSKGFDKSYYERFLWAQDFATVGLRILRLPGDQIDTIAVSTARGASLGVQTELYRWQDGVGMVNVMPSHPPAHH